MRKLFFALSFLICYQFIHAQYIGIGTTSPRALLHVADSNVLFTAPVTLPAVGLLPTTGAGNRMMWYSAKAALRAGGVTGTHWDENFIGKYSASFGLSNRAAGDYAASLGWGNSSSGEASFTAGYTNAAPGKYAAALGTQTDAPAYASFVIGRYNIAAGNNTAWVDTDPLFVVGNGYIDASGPVASIVRSNAFMIDKLGNASINGKLEVKGVASFKENIVVEKKASFYGDVSMLDTLTTTGKTIHLNTVEFNNLATLKDNTSLHAVKNSGASPTINLVPIGVASFRVVFDRSGIFDNCTSSFTNIAGNFISSSSSSCGDPTGLPSYVKGDFVFNTAQANQYTEVIAVPSITYNNTSNAFDPSFNLISSSVSKNGTTQKPESFKVGFTSSNIETLSVPSIYGTVMFYGLK